MLVQRNTRFTYDGVLNIPEGKVGTYAIEHFTHAAGTVLETTTTRGRLFGQAGPRLRYDFETKWHRLTYEGGVWMTDLPIEQRQHDELLLPIYAGTVLVGGLGLGYAATALAKKRGIRRIVVVEKAAEVIALVENAMRANMTPGQAAKIEVVHADLHEYLKRPNEVFTWAFYDIWQMDNEGEFFDTVVPLLRASKNIVRRRPVCWNEDVMRGQLLLGLVTRLRPVPGFDMPTIEQLATPVGNKWHDWRVPFFLWVNAAKPDDRAANTMANIYAMRYGEHDFDKTWETAVERMAQ